jgi:acylpyruvate hydrolase
MRLVTFEKDGQVRLGAQVRDSVLDLQMANPELPTDMLLLLNAGWPALETVREILASPIDPAAFIPGNEVRLLAPIPRPGKIICIGYNYQGHTAAGSVDRPEYPNFFCKTSNTIVGPNHPILIPRVSSQVDHEAELAVIIGKRGYDIAESDAMDYVAGYSIFNDVSARDYQNRSNQWLLGKSFDTFGPLGPTLVTADEIPDPHNLNLELKLNGQARQRANTQDMVFSIPFMVSYLSQVMTLEPGDVIATGTPSKLPEVEKTQKFLKKGDVIEVAIEKLGVLRNTVQ